MRPLTVILFLSCALPTVLPAQALPAASTVTHVADSLAAAFVASDGAPSVAIGLVRGTDTLELKAWGLADIEQDVPATARSVYRIGSVTKQFTAAAVMQLVEQGKVKLDDSIATYLPALPVAWHRVTVRQLLNHTSGIPSYTDIGPKWRNRWGEEMTPDTLIALTAGDPVWFAPGTQWRYDNSGYVVLGLLIEQLTGRPWGTDMAERFFKPLGMLDTRECLATPIYPRRVRGYEKDDDHPGQWENTAYLAMSQPYAAGSLCSTVGDLARWNRALHTGHVVSAASYALMTTPEGVAATNTPRYGFALIADTLAGRPIITHGGGIHGFITGNAWVPSAQLSVTVLTNSGSARAEQLLEQLVRAAQGMPLEQQARVVPIAADQLRRYVGVFALVLPNGAHDFTIAEAGDHLTAQLAGQEAIPLLHYGDHTFGASFDPSLRLFFTLDGGQATRVTLLQGGGHFEGVRK
ncbi:MAG: serine hydrolase domain-containing protein [Gemmatimonadota bacterium]